MNTANINIDLARYSDWAFTSAVVALVVALLLLAFELAYVRGRKVDERELVLAGSVASDATTPGIVLDGPRRPLDERVGRAGLAVVYLASGCCWPASCCAAWPPCGCPGATCTSSST